MRTKIPDFSVTGQSTTSTGRAASDSQAVVERPLNETGTRRILSLRNASTHQQAQRASHL
jgi:hypothetical protein